jgi:hypothetical protein
MDKLRHENAFMIMVENYSWCSLQRKVRKLIESKYLRYLKLKHNKIHCEMDQ